jgi:hypothetical protein
VFLAYETKMMAQFSGEPLLIACSLALGKSYSPLLNSFFI